MASPEWKVGGVIDFGDMVYTWRINELAIAMAYSMVSSWATVSYAYTHTCGLAKKFK